MSFSVIASPRFQKEAKRLSKKYASLKEELADLNGILAEAPETGTPLGNHTYKIRIAIKSKGKGKSGGGRVITYVLQENGKVYLLTIYDKSELDSIDDNTLKREIEALKGGA